MKRKEKEETEREESLGKKIKKLLIIIGQSETKITYIQHERMKTLL